MAEEPDRLAVLESQIDAISQTIGNLQGLVAKTARIQADLETGGLDEHADAVGESFSALSGATERLEEIVDDMKMERNRIQNGG